MTAGGTADRPPVGLPVVVVGAGPTGLTAALLLAVAGMPVVLLERHRGAYPQPRAVHLDDEVHRVLQRAGVAEAFAAFTRPAAGLRLLDGRHRTIAQFDRGTSAGPHGFAQATLFDQPDLEQVLREQLRAHPQVRLREQVEVLDVEGAPTYAAPVLVLEDLRTGERERLPAAAVLGCDGARSRLRTVVGAGFEDLGFEERWLVVDARCREPLAAWGGVHQVCDARRAATFMQVGPDRYRWEFQLRADESAAQLAAPARLAELVRPWAGDRELEVLRSGDYTFRARLADRWQRGRLFLLGDAAHLTPPFVGQGLGAGQRDAANLSWKLAAVLSGRAPERLLATYELERRPHARAMIRLAVTAGWAMTGGQGPAALVRRCALGALFRVPGLPQVLIDRGSPPLVRGPLVRRPRTARRSLVGRLAPQPRVVRGGRAVLLDELLGPGFAVVTVVAPDADLERLADRLDARVVRLDSLPGAGPLRDWLARGRASTAVLRPDRTVLLTARSPTAPGAELQRAAAVLRLVAATQPAAEPAVTTRG
jgi:3-(3-hydroxy-phenyl)propionate hydroxylase